MERGGGSSLIHGSIHMCPDEGQITSKVAHPQHSPHRSLTLCPLHTKEHDRKRHWADPKMHTLPRISTGGRHMPMYGYNYLLLIRAI